MDGWKEGARGCVRGGGLVLGKKNHIFISEVVGEVLWRCQVSPWWWLYLLVVIL